MPANFEKELETYRHRLESLLADQGKFVLIRQQELFGPFDTYEAAIVAGYGRYGLNSFFVKCVEQQRNAMRAVIAVHATPAANPLTL